MSYQTTLVDLLADSKQFQLIMDEISAVFEPPIWRNYLSDQYTRSLDWRAVMGVMETSPAASVIDFSAGKPVLTRPTVSKLNGELATLGNKWQMSKREVREFIDLQNDVANKVVPATELINYLFPDLQRAATSPHKTIDRLLLEGMSTGVMTLTSTNNPKGAIWNAALDWGIEQNVVATIWSNTASTPLTDINTVVEAWLKKGVTFRSMKMSRTTYNYMMATTQMSGKFGYVINAPAGQLTVPAAPIVAFADVNRYLESVMLPTIEIIDYPVVIEGKDGTRTATTPFADNRVTFSVGNNFGKLFWTFANEQQRPIAGKTYAVTDNVLISKYQNNDGNEFTECEFSAFPVLDSFKSIAILKTDATS